MKEVLGNLLSNAIKYTPAGSIAVSVSRKDDRILVTISDTGRGMNAKTIAGLFQKFSRGKNGNITAIAGSGLGLYLAKTFVTAHGGRIWAKARARRFSSSCQ